MEVQPRVSPEDLAVKPDRSYLGEHEHCSNVVEYQPTQLGTRKFVCTVHNKMVYVHPTSRTYHYSGDLQDHTVPVQR